MANLDAKFSGQIFRKDNPIILACRRDQAVFFGVRVAYDPTGYLPGQCIVRNVGTGLWQKWSAASGASNDSPYVLFDPCTDSAQLANNGGVTAGVSGSTLLRGLGKAQVYTNLLVDYDAAFKALIKSIDRQDSGGNLITGF
jgi:hypothetical protein